MSEKDLFCGEKIRELRLNNNTTSRVRSGRENNIMDFFLIYIYYTYIFNKSFKELVWKIK